MQIEEFRLLQEYAAYLPQLQSLTDGVGQLPVFHPRFSNHKPPSLISTLSILEPILRPLKMLKRPLFYTIKGHYITFNIGPEFTYGITTNVFLISDLNALGALGNLMGNLMVEENTYWVNITGASEKIIKVLVARGFTPMDEKAGTV